MWLSKKHACIIDSDEHSFDQQRELYTKTYRTSFPWPVQESNAVVVSGEFKLVSYFRTIVAADRFFRAAPNSKLIQLPYFLVKLKISPFQESKTAIGIYSR